MAGLVITSSIPEASLLKKLMPYPHFQDAYAQTFVGKENIAPVTLVKLFFTSMPEWVQVLLGIRDKVARVMGLKTAQNKKLVEQEIENFTGQYGEKIALFQVMGSNQQEIVMGQDDTHLNFRLSFRLEQRRPGEYRLWLITTVLLHNWLGRWYMAFVKPVHKLIVTTVLKNMTRHLETCTVINSEIAGKK